MSRARIQALVSELLEVDPSASPKPGTLPLAVPPFGQEEVVEAISALLEGRVTMGERVFEFERRYAEHTGTDHAIMVNSGSSALLVMLEALIEVGHLNRGDEVILPAVGWSTDVSSVWFQNTGYAWYMLVQVPLAIGAILASWLIHKATSQTTARAAAVSLTFTALLYFGLNSVFFGFPDLMAPLESWGGRHATHAYFMVTTVCLLLLSAATALIFPGCFVCRKSTDAASATE